LRYGIPKPIARSVIVDSIQEELMKRMVLITCALLLITGVALGQGVQTATLIGSVKSEGAPLPGVTVTASSPNLIGERVTVTSGNGDYVIRGVPPGEYKVTFTMDGMQSVEVTVSAGLGVTTRADANMALSVAAEMITVTADAPTALETTTVGKNTTYEEVQYLPVGKTPTSIAALAGGVTGGDRESSTPVANQLSISGGMAYDNSFMVNGVNVQDPIFGQTNNLFIEDAIAETQVLSSGISAEYGGFTGGVLNVITKSGGNDFTGSIRGDFTKPEWRDETPYEKGFRGDGVPTATPTKRSGSLGEIYSLTLGGPIVRDRLWFFGALRDQEDTLPVTLPVTNTSVPRVTTNTRWEVKLTGNITSNHSLQGSYIENPVDSTHEIQVTPIELAAVGINSTRENDGTAIAYNGVLTSKLFAEARYSEKHFGFRGLGGTSTNIVDSPMRNFNRHSAFAQQAGNGTFNAPYFDATDPEDRDNEQLYGALSYYLSTGSLGSHDIKGGIEEFTVTRTGGNSQSATNFVFYTPYLTNNGVVVYDNAGRLIPRFINIATSASAWTGLDLWVATRGAKLDITTTSFFLQDRWDINANWTANIGVRYEQVESDVTGADVIGLDTDTVAPRLALSYDPFADGRFKFDVSYAEYAGRYNPSIAADNSPVGNPAFLYGYYVGPNGSGRDFAPGFDPGNYVFYDAGVPTANVFVEDGLSSPTMEEITLSAGMALPKGGWAKVTFVDRNMKDFIDDFITIDQGCTEISLLGIDVGCVDNVWQRNTNIPERTYQAVLLQGRYNVMQNWMVEGNYTYQIENDGNYEGEGGQSIGSTIIGDRPEIYGTYARQAPTGRLSQYQEHKLRLWTTYMFNFGRAGNLSTGLIYRYDSPRTFSYTASVSITSIQRARDPGYQNPPNSQTVFFGERGAGEYNALSLFDLSLTYNIPLWGGRVEPWVKVDVLNLTNEDTLVTFNSAVSVDNTSPLDSDGIRTGFIKPAAFGRPTGAGSYLVPREYLISAGIRF
jgi:hypothetical protein